MSNKPTGATRRQTIGRVVAVASVAAVVAAGALIAGGTAGAAGTSTLMKITGVTPHLVTASTASQLITVKGSGFDESTISSVTIAGGTCTPSYMVTSPTSLVLKTPTGGCTTGVGTITINDTTPTTPLTAISVPGTVKTGAQYLEFVAAPVLAANTDTATLRNVVTLNSAGTGSTAAATSVYTASTKGGTAIRVTSGTGGFTAKGLAASLGGVALTGVKVSGTDATAGNFLTGIVGKHAAGTTGLVLKITNNGVSKSFVYATAASSPVADSFDFGYLGSSIVVSPTFGSALGTNTVKIAGAFSATKSEDAVTFGATAGTVVTATTSLLTVTVPVSPITSPATKDGPVAVTVVVSGAGANAGTSVVGVGSTYTYLSQ